MGVGEGVAEVDVVARGALRTFEVGGAVRVVGIHAYVETMGASAFEGHVFAEAGAVDQDAEVAAVDDERLARVIVEAEEIGLLQVEGAAFAVGGAATVAAAGGKEQYEKEQKEAAVFPHFNFQFPAGKSA